MEHEFKIQAHGSASQHRHKTMDLTNLHKCTPLGIWKGNPACRGTFGGRRKAVRDRFALQGGTGDFP